MIKLALVQVEEALDGLDQRAVILGVFHYVLVLSDYLTRSWLDIFA